MVTVVAMQFVQLVLIMETEVVSVLITILVMLMFTAEVSHYFIIIIIYINIKKYLEFLNLTAMQKYQVL